jgi:hypothetical protein
VISADSPITDSAVTARVIDVERSVRTLVHSARTAGPRPVAGLCARRAQRGRG